MFKIYHIDIIWYICAYKTRVYGKGYSCASDASHLGDEASGLVFQQHKGRFQRVYG